MSTGTSWAFSRNLSNFLSASPLKGQRIRPKEVLALFEKVDLQVSLKTKIKAYSFGMKKKIAIAQAIADNPEVLILDEPVNGLDPVGMREMRVLFRQLVDQDGMTILLPSHLLSEVQQVTDRIGIIADGRLVLEEDTEEIRRNHPCDIEDYLIGVMEGGQGR